MSIKLMENILLLSKEILRTDYLSCYGGKICRTRNIDKLAERGTIFTNCYTPAPSTAMAITCMFSGLNAYELDRRDYTEVKPFAQAPTLFSLLDEKEYETHVVWPFDLAPLAWKYSKAFHPHTKIHNLRDVGMIIPHFSYLSSESQTDRNIGYSAGTERFLEEIYTIVKNGRTPIFIWTHLPHAIKPRNCYGSDIDLFDKFVGEIMDFFDGSIYITADHSHMNCEKNITAYGFHVYEGAIRVPLITPRIMGRQIIEEPISLIQLKNIIIEKEVFPQEYIYSDSQYYQQPNRKLAIRKGDFKYIYNKMGKGEELYDLSIDPQENVNLLIENWYDPDRKKLYPLDQIYYYHRWGEAKKAYEELKAERNRIWRSADTSTSLLLTIRAITARYIIKGGILEMFRGIIPRRKRLHGRWGSRARITGI